MNLYQDTAIEVYLGNVKNKCPEISEWELELLKTGFRNGFNIGTANNESNLIKELALKSLAL